MSGASLMLFPEELEAICGLPHAQQLLYLAIRWRMDGRSFLAGEPARLSDQYLRERIEVTAERGRREAQLFKATRHQLRWLLDALVTRGLLQRVQGCELVFRLPVAAQASSVRRTSAQFPRASSAQGVDGLNASVDAGTDGVGEFVSAHDEAAISAPPQRSVNSYSVVEPEGEGEGTRVAPTVAGALCRRLRAAGVQGAQPNHPRLLEALGEGISPEAIEAVAAELVSKGQGPPKLAYVVATARGRAKDGKGIGNGTGTGKRGGSAAERVDRAFELGEQRARERVSGLRVIVGGREA